MIKRIKEIEVTGLFGQFHHSVPLNLAERITIIHAPNGLGKTVLLRMVDQLFKGNYHELRTIPFRKLRVRLDDESLLEITRKVTERHASDRSNAILDVALTTASGERKSYSAGAETIHGIAIEDFVNRMLPFPFEQVGPDLWVSPEFPEPMTTSELARRFGLPATDEGRWKEREWMNEFRNSVNVHFIQTHRLIYFEKEEPGRRVRSGRTRLNVERYSDELSSIIQSKLAESAALSQALDRTFPARLVNQVPSSLSSTADLQSRLSSLEERRSRLKAAGLLDKDEDMQFQVPARIDEKTISVLSVYAEDVEKKLGVFDDIASKLDLMTTLVNSRFLYKTLQIQKKKGFVFTAQDGTPLTLADLSSGEQQELVLLYELLFKVPRNSLILIDEPEISLHVAWQLQFLDDLKKITALSPFDVLLATHSPQIINDRWDLTLQLKGTSK